MAWWAIICARSTATCARRRSPSRSRTTACARRTRANQELEDEFWRYTHTDENSDRVGEFAIGTNIGVHDVIGNILQDEKIPGIHIAFGNPYGAHTGADWYSGTHIDVVGRKFDIWIDDRQIMHAGEFLLDSLASGSGLTATTRRRGIAASSTFSSERCGEPPQFRHSETPVFLPAALVGKMARYGREMVEQLLANSAVPARLARPRFQPSSACRTKTPCRSSCRPISAWTQISSRSWSRSRASRRSTPISR